MLNIPCNRLNYGRKRKTEDITSLVFHYTGNRTDTAKANAEYFKKVRGASAHFFTDRVNIVQSVSPEYVAYSVGGKKYSDCKKTGGGSYYKVVTNANSISIEMCSNAGKIAEETQENAIRLAQSLMRQYPSIKTLVRHFDVNGKHCPAWDGWMGSNASLWYTFRYRVLNEWTNNIDAVFDADYYLSNNSDLTEAGITKEFALAHFLVNGINEGRKAKDTFDVKVYRASNPDLERAFGNKLAKYYEHYCTYGKKENRKAV